jgi:hypothetical protein
VLGAPVYHGWYDRAQVGMHHRMGDKVVQNYGLSKQAVMALQVVLEWEWQAAGDSRVNKMGVVQLTCFIFFRYARALRGKEIPNIELTGVIKYFPDGATTKPPPCEFVSDWTIQARGGRSAAFLAGGGGDGVRIETEKVDGTLDGCEKGGWSDHGVHVSRPRRKGGQGGRF